MKENDQPALIFAGLLVKPPVTDYHAAMGGKAGRHGTKKQRKSVRLDHLVSVATLAKLKERKPAAARVLGLDLVVIRYGKKVSVFFGRCLHRGALLADGFVDGDNLICGLHGWDYRIDSGVSEYNNEERLHKFAVEIDERSGEVMVSTKEVRKFLRENPQPYDHDAYLGSYQDVHGTDDEPYNGYIQELAKNGLTQLGHHGRMSAMGVPRHELPQWDDVQLLTGQLKTRPLADDADVATKTVIGPMARKPLELDIPLFVSDMSFGALSAEAKTALAKGADMAGTGICSGEGGMLPAEQAANQRYFYELASAHFGWSLEKVRKCQAFHFKAGQAAKTGTGGHLPGEKVTKEIADVRGLEPGEAAVSPSRFAELKTPKDFGAFADIVREQSGGIPIGFKMSCQHIEDDIDFAIDADVDYIIIDGRGGATGAAPEIFKSNIGVPLLAALPRARAHLRARGRDDITLVATGGLRTESDFVKAMALGADAIAIANSALQAIGCLGMRACHTNNCPVGIATQKTHLRARLVVDASAERLASYLTATVDLMKILARACGHESLHDFSPRDLTSWHQDIAKIANIRYAGAQ